MLVFVKRVFAPYFLVQHLVTVASMYLKLGFAGSFWHLFSLALTLLSELNSHDFSSFLNNFIVVIYSEKMKINVKSIKYSQRGLCSFRSSFTFIHFRRIESEDSPFLVLSPVAVMFSYFLKSY